MILFIIYIAIIITIIVLSYHFPKKKNNFYNQSITNNNLLQNEINKIDIEKENISDLNEKVIVSSINELNEIAGKNEEKKEKLESKGKSEEKQIIKKISNYKLPPVNILNPTKNKVNNDYIPSNNVLKALSEYGINDVKIIDIRIGPKFTLYELSIKKLTDIKKISKLKKELALSLCCEYVNLYIPLPNKDTIGIEVVNKHTHFVSFGEVYSLLPDKEKSNKLLVVLGKNNNGLTKFLEIDKALHLIIGGTTGSGKTVFINSIIASLLMRTKPDEVKLVLIDTKKIELNNYNGIPHLLMPVATNSTKANNALKKLVSIMEYRFKVFSENNVKNINSYLDLTDDNLEKMPYIIVIIDELLDLMRDYQEDTENSILRLTQDGHNVGIHLIVSTQRPSLEIMKRVVKCSFPSKISFTTASTFDSKIILDTTGAEKLSGHGDMLFLPTGESNPERVQGVMITDEEIERIINWTVEQSKDKSYSFNQGNIYTEEEYDDPLYHEVVEFVKVSRKASASLIQRRFKIGYNRASRIIDLLEERGMIGPAIGAKPREVLIPNDDNVY